MPVGEVPLRHRLLVRLLAASALIAICSIAATAWLAARTTTRAIRDAQGQSLATDARIYDQLVGYAATHASWRAVAPTLRRLAHDRHRAIVLTTRARRPIASTAASRPLPAIASAVVDPLHVDALPSGNTDLGGIDPRALGPFALQPADRRRLTTTAARVRSCFAAVGVPAVVARWPAGHPHVVAADQDPMLTAKVGQGCDAQALDRPVGSERAALSRLNRMIRRCVDRRSVRRADVRIGVDLAFAAVPAAARPCVDAARRRLLTPAVAPPALLFITAPGGQVVTRAQAFDLSGHNRTRIAVVAGLVLALTVAVTALLAMRLTRPLRQLGDAARQSRTGSVHVPVRSRDEIGQLAEALNDLSARREQLEEQRRAMVRDVAHELRTPLANIRSSLEAAEDGVIATDAAFTRSVLDEALHLQHIIDDLTDLAAADAGDLRLRLEPVAVDALLEQVAAIHRARAVAAGVALEIETARGLPTLTADRVRLRQAVTNLVDNAVRHTPPGGTVTLRARPDERAGGAVVEVADTGAGIAPDDLDRVFDRFWRADRSRSRTSGGSGLGLAIVRHLVEAHGGSATASATPGGGATFTLRLPRERPSRTLTRR